MAVAAEPAEIELFPGLDEVRELAREHTLVPLRHTFVADTETPVSAYLKLRGGGPSFLLESAEQGQRFGRWSFLGFRPRAVIRWRQGNPDELALPDLALMISDVLVAFDHLRHEVTVLTNVFAEEDVDRGYEAAAATSGEVRERLAA